jgi:hypothetical protein
VHEGHAVGRQQAPDPAEQLLVPAEAHVLQEADRHDPVEPPRDLAVVAAQEAGTFGQAQLAGPGVRPCVLLPGQGDAGHVDLVAAGEVQGEAAPAAPQVEDPLAGLEEQLGGDVVLLGALRRLETFPARRMVGARVLPLAVEEQRVELAGKVVVVRHVPRRPAARVALVDQAQEPARHCYPRRGVPPGEAAVDVVRREQEQFGDVALLEDDAPVHVAFAEGEARPEHELQLQPAVQEPHRHAPARRPAEAAAPPAGVDDL